MTSPTPDALRAAFLDARERWDGKGLAPKELVALVKQARANNWSIPEVDAFVSQQLASAREGLETARRAGVAPEVIAELERLVAFAEGAEKIKVEVAQDPATAQAIEAAGRLAETAKKLTDVGSVRAEDLADLPES